MILLVTFKPRDAERAIVAEVAGTIAEICYLADFDDRGRRDVLSRADVMLSRNPGNELRPDELPLVHNARLIQFLARAWTTFGSTHCRQTCQ